jgi:hypothetical protein
MAAPQRVKQPAVDPDDLPLEERIRQRAYQLYVQRGDQAENEIRNMAEQKEGR